MRRREFICAFIGAASWPVSARAQQAARPRRIAVMLPYEPDDPESQARVGAFIQQLQQLGWPIGRRVRIDIRWVGGNLATYPKHVADLVALKPDVILAHGSGVVRALLRVTRDMPIVFPVASDPVGAGHVASLAHPGGNVTGFLTFEYGQSGKWLQLLKQIEPHLKRVAVIRDPRNQSGIGQFGAIQAVAPMLGTEAIPVDIQNLGKMEGDIAQFAKNPHGGLIVTTSGLAAVHRKLIIGLAAKHKLPAIYFEEFFATDGGLMSYGPDFVEQYRSAASYVDRILRGEKPADLPVQAPTKYELVINSRTAKALGLTIPSTLLAQADEVIE